MTRLQRSIAQGSDDGFELAVASPDITNGGLAALNQNAHIGLRFQNVMIPQGATIDRVAITLVCVDTLKNDASGLWYCQAIDNAPTFTTTNGDIDGRTKTVASVPWTQNDLGTAGAAVTTPDLTVCLQEVVNRPGWAAGNSVVFLYHHTSGAVFASFAAFDSPLHAEPSLRVDWAAIDLAYQESFNVSHRESFGLTYGESSAIFFRESA